MKNKNTKISRRIRRQKRSGMPGSSDNAKYVDWMSADDRGHKTPAMMGN